MALIKYQPNRLVAPAVRPATNLARPSTPTAPSVKPAPATGMARPMTAQMPQEADTTGEEAPLSNEDIISIILGASRTSSGGGGTFTGETTPQRLAREAASRGAVSQANYLRDVLGQVPGQYQQLISGVSSAFQPARSAAETSYASALQALQGRRTEAEGLTGTSQEALRSFLAANPSQAFASLPAAQAPSLEPNVIARYAAATGVPASSIAQAAAEESAILQGNASGYDRLRGLLQASEARANQSRMTEYELLKAVQDAQLRTQYGAGTTTLEAQRQAALNQIASQEAAQVFALQQAQAAREQSLRDALASLYGTGNVAYAPGMGQIPDLSGVDFEALGRLMRGR